jgi:predicted DNA-binding transcriptional regulator AlpA
MKLCFTRAELADQLGVSPDTVDEYVRQGVLPRPIRFSAGCIRWRSASVDAALASLEGGGQGMSRDDADAGVQRAIQTAKDRRRGRAA